VLRRYRRRPSPLAALALIALASALPAGCGGGSSKPPSSGAQVSSPTSVPGIGGFDGAALPAGAPVPGFTLTDQRGARVSLASYRGEVTILAFPYSGCGDACVVIAEQIRGALDELGRPVPVLFVSSDPEADTLARVRAFLARTSLSGRVRYLSGSRAQLRPVWRSFHVVLPSAGSAAFDSSASVILLDREGRERVIFQLEQLTPEALAHDVRKLLAEGAK
jgi:protein SCO1